MTNTKQHENLRPTCKSNYTGSEKTNTHTLPITLICRIARTHFVVVYSYDKRPSYFGVLHFMGIYECTYTTDNSITM